VYEQNQSRFACGNTRFYGPSLLPPLEIFFMIIMIKLIEEPQAVRKFGEAYLRYRGQVPMFSLDRECIMNLFAKPTLESD